MRRHVIVPSLALAAALATMAAPEAQAVEPGVDIASPRVAITTVDAATLMFHPASIVVEQNDHVRWRWTGGAHNTTSATTTSSCLASGLWSSALNSLTTVFTRQFTEDAPATVPFFCSPHCGLGMRGQVIVTSEIDARAVPAAGGAVRLDWTGGGGAYRLFRSPSPLFPAAAITVLTTANGTTALTFTDTTGGTPAVGGAYFYLVMNHFGP